MSFPMSVRHGSATLEVNHFDGQCFRVTITGSRGSWMPLELEPGAMRAFADLFYRLLGEQPRDVVQRVVLEHVGRAALGASVQETAQDAEKEAIKLRLMR